MAFNKHGFVLLNFDLKILHQISPTFQALSWNTVYKLYRKLMVSLECAPYLFHTGNTVLIVAHASSLEACTRQIQGLSPQNSKDFVQVVRKVSFSASV